MDLMFSVDGGGEWRQAAISLETRASLFTTKTRRYEVTKKVQTTDWHGFYGCLKIGLKTGVGVTKTRESVKKHKICLTNRLWGVRQAGS